MKKDAAEFKKRYGKDWKSVMYATATNQAMAEQTTTQLQSQKYTDVMADVTKELENILSMVARELNISQLSQDEQQEFLDSAVATLASKLSVPSQLMGQAVTEMSMAAGGVEGAAAGGARVAKRNKKSLIGEEDDD